MSSLTLANKCDIPNKTPREREVTNKEAEEYANENELLYAGETSAMHNINISNTISRLTQEINDV